MLASASKLIVLGTHRSVDDLTRAGHQAWVSRNEGVRHDHHIVQVLAFMLPEFYEVVPN